MRSLDIWLQNARLRRASDRIAHGTRILDVGCHQGELARKLRGHGCVYHGIDDLVDEPTETIVAGRFPADIPRSWIDAGFDHLVALAVLEHVPRDELDDFFAAARDCLGPGGTVIATVPSPVTDHVLDVLAKLRLIDGMDLEAHDGLTIAELTAAAARAGLELTEHRRFQLGLNNTLVWSKPADA